MKLGLVILFNNVWLLLSDVHLGIPSSFMECLAESRSQRRELFQNTSNSIEFSNITNIIIAIRRTALPANSAGQAVDVKEERQRVIVVLIRVLDAPGIPAAKFCPAFTHVGDSF